MSLPLLSEALRIEPRTSYVPGKRFAAEHIPNPQVIFIGQIARDDEDIEMFLNMIQNLLFLSFLSIFSPKKLILIHPKILAHRIWEALSVCLFSSVVAVSASYEGM